MHQGFESSPKHSGSFRGAELVDTTAADACGATKAKVVSVTTRSASRKHELTSESVQALARHLLSGTLREAQQAVEEIDLIIHTGDTSAIDFLVDHGCVPALIHHVVRDANLDEASQSLATLFALYVYLAAHHDNTPNIVGSVAASIANTRSATERKNALRALLSFAYTQQYAGQTTPHLSLLTQVHGFLGDLVRHLWEPPEPEKVTEALDVLLCVASVPQYRTPLCHVLVTVVAEKRRMSTSSDGSGGGGGRKRRSSSLLAEISSHPASLLETGFGFFKRLVSSSEPTAEVPHNGVHGLIQLVANGCEAQRAVVTSILEQLSNSDDDKNREVHRTCGLLYTALVRLVSNPHGQDRQKIRAMLCMERLIKSQRVRRHLHHASVSPELYLVANLGSARCREHAERLLGQLIEQPDSGHCTVGGDPEASADGHASSKLFRKSARRPSLKTVTPEDAQAWTRHLLSGTAQEAHAATNELHAVIGNAETIDCFIAQSGVPALVHHMLRDQSLDEQSLSLDVLFQMHLFLASERNGVPDIVATLTTHVDKSVVMLERKNALRIILAFGYVKADPTGKPAPQALLLQLKETLMAMLKSLWEPPAPDSIAFALECLQFLSSVPQYRAALCSVLLEPVVDKQSRSMSSDKIKPEVPTKRRATSVLIDFVARHPSAILGSSIEFIKGLLPSVPEVVLVPHGVNGLVQLIAKGSEKDRASVTQIFETLAKADDDAQRVCSEIFKAVVGLLSNPAGDDEQKVRAMGVMEKLVKYQKVRRHLHRASVSPELFLVANLASPRPREQAERLLSTLIDQPEFAEFVKANV
ncbi:hypothetical protein ACHHYP_04457 [Achlya hypogyna]|uniref:Uncharacterized protein n=1 Tax=Achlya hypogyna TaxID=1202772 RepID=A0A1V9Z168_ACHHY|nr:hypothetical protein ACHHYP_04457 [Achlya hypogyna]